MLRKFLGAALALACAFACAVGYAATILPPGETQFFDNNGQPLAGGSVYFYIPGTTAPKSTYRNSAGTVLNPNPVILDSSGRAIIYGSGSYQETVKDATGSLVWSQITADTSSTNYSWGGTSGGSANAQTLTDPNFSLTDGQVIGFIAGFTNTGATTLTVNGGSPLNIVKGALSGPIALTGNEIVTGNQYQVSYSSTNGNLQLLSYPLTLQSGAYSQVVTSTSGVFYSPVFDVTAFGAVGNGTTNNNAAFTSAFAAAAGGGQIKVPCGTYLLTSTPSVNITAGKHVEFVGSGSDCTVILMSGVVNGPTFIYGNQWSSLRVANMTIETDQAGGTTCLVAAGGFVSPLSAYSASTFIENVTLRGTDAYGASTKYCNVGFSENSISNVSITGFTYNGPSVLNGTAIALVGSGSGSTYSVQVNITNSVINNCSTGISYGDWVQGVQMSTDNITGCANGVIVTGSPSGGLAQLAITTSQINTSSCGVCVNDATFANLQVTNTQFIVNPNSIGIKASGTNWILSGNEVNAPSTTGSQAIVVGSTFGNGGSIIGNHLVNFGTAITVGALSQSPVKIDANNFTNNTTDYSINASSAGVTITDTEPRILSSIPACGASTKFSQYRIANSGTSTFFATISSTGNNIGNAICDGTNLIFH